MTEKPTETPKEELECPKKYVYDTGIIFECKENSRVEILGEDVVDLLNELTTKCSKLEKENEELKKDNNELIGKIKKLEKEIHLIHMSSMFSTVKSFKGDVSKRYTYNEETDTIYDTANNYGQYHKILDKKEITMLLNEYETVLNEEEQE